MMWQLSEYQFLIRRWKEGDTAQQIADELGNGITRGAVMGKVWRLVQNGKLKPRRKRQNKSKTTLPVEPVPEKQNFSVINDPKTVNALKTMMYEVDGAKAALEKKYDSNQLKNKDNLTDLTDFQGKAKSMCR